MLIHISALYTNENTQNKSKMFVSCIIVIQFFFYVYFIISHFLLQYLIYLIITDLCPTSLFLWAAVLSVAHKNTSNVVLLLYTTSEVYTILGIVSFKQVFLAIQLLSFDSDFYYLNYLYWSHLMHSVPMYYQYCQCYQMAL